MKVLVRVIVVVLLLAAGWKVGHQLIALELFKLYPSEEILRQAILWDPESSEHHRRLGLIYRDDPEYQDLQLAQGFLETAVHLNPFDWRGWLQLARVYEISENPDLAERAYLKTVDLNPRWAGDRWRLANFYLRMGNFQKAVSQFKVAIELQPAQYLQPALTLLWKAEIPIREILYIWPEDKEARLMLMRFLAKAQYEGQELLGEQWANLFNSTNSPTIMEGEFYLRYLLSKNRFQEARRVWIQLAKENDLQDDEYTSNINLIWNGRFKLPITQRIFGWVKRFRENLARVDVSDGLRIEFQGTKNIDFVGLTQLVIVEPGQVYKFSFKARSEGLTTEQGLYFEVFGPPVMLKSKQVLGTTHWKEYSGLFKVPKDKNFVTVRLRRRPSKRINNKFSGTLWLNSVNIERAS